MALDDVTNEFGPEYPSVIRCNGGRFVLSKETAVSRHYSSENRDRFYIISKFMDGSATMSIQQLRISWQAWTAQEKLEFCQACKWLGDQNDFIDMLRYVMKHGDSSHKGAIACSVAKHLPQAEAFTVLVHSLSTDNGVANIAQGIVLTSHPGARNVLSGLLDHLWSESTATPTEMHFKGRAFDMICTIQCLLELGAPSKTFTDKIRSIFDGSSPEERDYCSRHLRRHYRWMSMQEGGNSP